MDLGALEIEIKEGLKTLENLENIVTIFGGARIGCESKEYRSVMKLARKLGAKRLFGDDRWRTRDYGSCKSRAYGI